MKRPGLESWSCIESRFQYSFMVWCLGQGVTVCCVLSGYFLSRLSVRDRDSISDRNMYLHLATTCGRGSDIKPASCLIDTEADPCRWPPSGGGGSRLRINGILPPCFPIMCSKTHTAPTASTGTAAAALCSCSCSNQAKKICTATVLLYIQKEKKYHNKSGLILKDLSSYFISEHYVEVARMSFPPHKFVCPPPVLLLWSLKVRCLSDVLMA